MTDMLCSGVRSGSCWVECWPSFLGVLLIGVVIGVIGAALFFWDGDGRDGDGR